MKEHTAIGVALHGQQAQHARIEACCPGRWAARAERMPPQRRYRQQYEGESKHHPRRGYTNALHYVHPRSANS